MRALGWTTLIVVLSTIAGAVLSVLTDWDPQRCYSAFLCCGVYFLASKAYPE